MKIIFITKGSGSIGNTCGTVNALRETLPILLGQMALSIYIYYSIFFAPHMLLH